jgi:hypothetical protein
MNEPKLAPVTAPVAAAVAAPVAAVAAVEASSWLNDDTEADSAEVESYFAGVQKAEAVEEVTPATTAINIVPEAEDPNEGVFGDDLDIPDFLR